MVGFTRLKFEENQQVPGWAGWLSLTSKQAFNKNLSIYDYIYVTSIQSYNKQLNFGTVTLHTLFNKMAMFLFRPRIEC